MVNRSGARLPIKAEWFDLWHAHVDWNGEGNYGPESRRLCLQALFEAWTDAEMSAGELSCFWQSWLVIDPQDSSQDAVYLHSRNPNRDNFPYPFEGVSWGIDSPAWLAEFINPLGTELGRSESDESTLYWVRRTPAGT